MIRYIKCPRCELNYIDADRQEYCDVCIAEMKGNRLQFADLDDDDYGTLDEEIEDVKICPVCGINRLRPGETMCEECRAKQEYEGEDDTEPADEETEEDDELDPDREDEWQRYLDTDDSDLAVADEKIKQELEEEFGGDEDEDFKDDYLEDNTDSGSDESQDEDYDPYLDGELDDDDEDDEDDDDDDDDDSDSDDDF
ncbi:MAG: hypothetical protein LUD51_00940 [Clostridia bacterium]|nr:hypothetical protein [Clostridia bacterium]